MTLMLCRNRVADFDRWRSVFDSHLRAHEDAGLRLVHLWRTVEDPNNVFFVFDLASVERARAFIEDPEAAAAGEQAGVLDGEYHFVEEAPTDR